MRPKVKQALSPTDKLIASKEKLIVKLGRDIEAVREQAEDSIAKIQFRIEIARTLLGALKKGRA